ncbi:hypothetical protein BK139_08915 [Paenibacillus sp. FSL R5-0490]|uniref:hypothetical protein n=1 Tax=Bacillales TaxID=1385 RepID=UPI00096E3CE0|nr:hypothetical protein [Paenibacillus sp. FSL R5-0490]OMF60973.1 hypothetical protein BK139_08915 [Paenibacillus sp. FSL R5-0490]
MRLQNQIIIEWTIRNHYNDFSFEKHLADVINESHTLKEGEALQIHQVVPVGEFNNEKVYIIILNIVPEKVN